MPKHQNGRATHEAGPAPQRAKAVEAQPAHSPSLRHLVPGAIAQRALAAPQTLRPADLMALQRTIGNQAVNALLGSIGVQAKLIVNAPGDRYEREADRVAEEVMRTRAVPREETPATLDPPQVMTKPTPELGNDGSFAAGEDFSHQLDASQGRGRPLPPALRETFEGRFGADFSAVRLHADDQAGRLRQAIQAQAFTRGPDIFLGAGHSAPDSMAGQRLLAHELTHVVQQGAAPRKTSKSSQPATEPGIPGRPISGQIQRKLAFEETNWSKAKEVRVSKGGAGGALFVRDEISQDEPLVVKSREKAPAEVLLGVELRRDLKMNKWSIKAPRARNVFESEAQQMQQMLPNLLNVDDWPDSDNGRRKGNDILGGLAKKGAVVYEFASGIDLTRIVMSENSTKSSKYSMSYLLKKKDFVRSLGILSSIDIFTGNFDRLVRLSIGGDPEITQTDNLKIDAKSKIIYAVDNVDDNNSRKDYKFDSPLNVNESSWHQQDLTVLFKTNDFAGIANKSRQSFRFALMSDLRGSVDKQKILEQLSKENYLSWFAEGLLIGKQRLPKIVAGLSQDNSAGVLATARRRLSYLMNADQPWESMDETRVRRLAPTQQTIDKRRFGIEGEAELKEHSLMLAVKHARNIIQDGVRSGDYTKDAGEDLFKAEVMQIYVMKDTARPARLPSLYDTD